MCWQSNNNKAKTIFRVVIYQTDKLYVYQCSVGLVMYIIDFAFFSLFLSLFLFHSFCIPFFGLHNKCNTEFRRFIFRVHIHFCRLMYPFIVVIVVIASNENIDTDGLLLLLLLLLALETTVS